MGCPQIGHDADSGLHDALQFGHFARLRDTCLDKSHIIVRTDEPHTQRHTHLAVVAARRTTHVEVGRQQLIQPLLHGGLSI